MKRRIAMLLCVLMLVSALPLTSFAAYENTHTNTGNQIEDLISVATTQIGYTEGNSTSQQGGTSAGSGNYTKYGAWYGINPGAWCAMFVSWCANQAGISSSIVPKHASCDLGMQWFQNNSKWQWSLSCGGSYTPKRGDIIYFRTKTNQVTDSTHVGIVYAADASTVYTIEGNTSNKCARKSYSTSSAYILGYGTPAYTGSDSSGGGTSTGSYTITMDPNGGTMVGSTTYKAAYGDTYTKIFGSYPMAARSGYVLTGWLCEKYSFTLTDSNMGNYFAVYENATFKAQWAVGSVDETPVDESFTITFDPNGGTMTSQSSYSINTGDYYKDVIGTMPTATRSGYTLSGWYNEKYNYTLSLGSTETFAVAEDVTFKAQWTKNDSVTITLNAGPCGNGATKTISTTTLYHDKASIYSNYGLLPSGGSSDQRVFMGWYTGYDATTGRGTGSMYWDTYTGSSGATLYAIWGYPIAFNADGGTYNDGSSVYVTYVTDYDGSSNAGTDNADPKSRYIYCIPDLFDNAPTKGSLERSNAPSYALVTASGDIFTLEGTAQNLTIPPTGGAMTWSQFRCTDTVYGTAVEFVAIWKPTVSYNANGGSGSMSTDTLEPNLDSYLYTYESYSVRGNTFTKSGASFTGWNTKADGSGTSYSAGQTITKLPNSNAITLYAQWSDGSSDGGSDSGSGTYTITLNANGGSPSKTYTIDDGQKYTAVIGSTMPKPTKSNAVFNGWYNEEYDFWLLDNSSATFNVGKDITFYAQWEEYSTFSDTTSGSSTLTFDPNGGTMKTGKSFSIELNQTYWDACGGVPFATKFGYTLDSWYLAQYGFGMAPTESAFKGNYLTVSGSFTFVAQWTYLHDHTCSYTDVRVVTAATCTATGSKLQACLCGNTKTVSISKTAHSYTVAWPDIAATCTSNAYTQKKCANCEAVQKTAQSGTKLDHSYTEWVDQGDGTSSRSCTLGCGTTETKNNVYTITYKDMGGAEFSGTLHASTKTTHTYGTATTLYTPTKTGHTFGGWYIESDCSGTKLTSLAAKGYTSDITLYAMWSTTAYTVTYYYVPAATGNSENEFDTDNELSWLSEGYPTSHIYGIETELPTVTREGWTWCGVWYTDDDCVTPAEGINSLSADGYSANIKLYTRVVVNTYNIEYYDQGGLPFTGTHASGQYTSFVYNTAYTLKTATRTGYTFDGWYLDAACTNKLGTALAKNTYAHDLKLYAKWTPKTYTITYYRSDSTSTAVTVDWFPEGYPTIHTYDTDTVLPAEMYRPGWSFNGWYTKTTYTDDYKVTVLDGAGYTANIKLYAYFTVNTYNIEYFDMGGAAFSGENLDSLPTTFTYNAAKTLTKGTKTGYTFSGWYTDPECTVSIGTSLVKNTYPNDIKLYAKWTPVSSEITYRTVNSTSGFGSTYMPEGYPTTHTYDTDTVLLDPVREGYTFDGWYSNKAGTTPIDVIDAKAYPTSTDIYIYGKWVANTYNISYYDEGGAAFSGENLDSLLAEFSYATKYTLTKGTKTGYTFSGWYTDPECTVSIGTTLAASTYPNDIKLYAKWTANSYTITYYRGTSSTKMTGTTYFPDGYPATHTYDTTTVLPTNVVYGTRYFLGFYTDTSYTNRVTELGPKDYTSAIKLYSKWETEANHVCTGDHTDGTYTLTDTIEATCSSAGQYTYTCYCNNSTGSQEIPYVYVDIPALSHSYVDHDAKAASCTEIGWNAYQSCENCDYTTYSEIPALGHSEATREEGRVDASCTVNGSYSLVTYCTVCSAVISTESVILTTPGHSYSSKVTPPTCTEDGYTTYTCTVCSDSYTDDIISSNGHSYDAAVTSPSCTQDGYTTYTCTACGDSYTTDEVKAFGHSYDAVVTEPTCIDGGYTTYSCAICAESYVDDEIGALGHDYEGVVTAPGCTEAGYTTYNCSRCDDSYTADEIEALGHTEVEKKENIIKASCGIEGSYELVIYCDVCGEELSRELTSEPALEHSYSVDGLELRCIHCNEGYNGFYLDAEDNKYYSVEGVITTGVFTVEDKYYYADETGIMYRDGRYWIEGCSLADGTYTFDAEGAIIFPTGYSIVTIDSKNYLMHNGVIQSRGLYEIAVGQYVYVCYENQLLQDAYMWVTKSYKEGLIEGEGCVYYFNSEFLLETERFVEYDGLCYYIDSDASALLGFQRIGDDYYYFNARNGLMYRDTLLWVGANDYGIEAGNYYFDAEGKLYIAPETGVAEIIEEKGELYYTIDNVKQFYGLYELDGEYYYAQSNGVLAVNSVVWVSNTNGLVENKAYYAFDSEGKLIKTGFVEAPSGYTYYYENCEPVKGLAMIGEDYYFFNASSGMMYKDAVMWIGSDNEYGFTAGYYTFLLDGRMYIVDPNGAKKIVNENGIYYFTIDGVKQSNGVYELEGEYCYAKPDGTLYCDTVLWLTAAVAQQFGGEAGYYAFDSEARLVKTGFVEAPNGYSYYRDELALAKGLTKIGEDYYFFNKSSGSMYTDTKIWIGADNSYGFAYGYYYFDAEGKCTGKV